MITYPALSIVTSKVEQNAKFFLTLFSLCIWLKDADFSW